MVLLAGGALVAVSITAAVHPHMGLLSFRALVVVPLMAVIVVVALWGRVPAAVGRRLADRGRWLDAGVVPGVAVLGAAASTVAARLIAYGYGWDAHTLMQFARRLHGGFVLEPYAYDYLSLYPNTIAMLAIDRGYLALGDVFGVTPQTVAIAVNGLCLGVTLWIVGRFLRPRVGLRWAVLAQLVVIALVGLSPWMSVPYTDVPAMPFVVGAVALGVRAVDVEVPWRRILFWSGAALSVAVAYIIKSTPAVLLVALVLFALVVALEPTRDRPSRRRRLVRAVVASLGAGAVFAVGSAGLTSLATATSGIDASQVRPDVTPPVMWWLANGMNSKPNPRGGTSYGTYDRAMVEGISGRTPEEATAYARSFIHDRWEGRGAVGTAQFYGAKTVWNWGDGMFWAWGEGGDLLISSPRLSGPAVDVMWSVDNPSGAAYPARADLTQALWLSVLLLTGLGALLGRPRREVLLLALVLLGAAGFTLLFQGRSRYIFVFAPVVVMMCALTLPSLRGRRNGSGADH
ncbi:hypothetical protein N803_16695 [Knoellia subterranea KCTC 19937]|uniref:Glycosyltransferase RgtA/B/C/D-like domain-containing protein n=1 Tax=Knoellia subterranea KCTC 19937 TaxID=1385521 RepID=A0A0A0JK00_9MICO|nr:hypothetical protein N803_16695 [Knoellia subterranea KCTC 19937]